MFGMTKLVAGVLVVTFAATLALVRPFDGDQDTRPGAERQVPWPALIEGVIGFGEETSEATVERVDDSDLLRFRGRRAVGPTREMSDPRLEGIVTLDSSWDTYRGNMDDPSVAVFTGMIRIENEGGAWQSGPMTGVTLSDDRSTTDTLVLRGEGAYEGLTAVLEFVQGQGSFTVAGAILGGDLPTLPESP